MTSLVELIVKVTDPLRRRLANLVSRGFVKSTDDQPKLQTVQVQVLDGETHDDVERVQPYGLTSVPLQGAEAVVLFVGGRRDHGLAISVDDRRYRIGNLNAGEVAVYNHTGAKIVFKANGDIELEPAAGRVVAIAGQSEPAVLGTAFKTAVANALTSIAGALTTMGAGGATPMPGTLALTAGTTVGTAVTAFNAAAGAALSTKVKLS